MWNNEQTQFCRGLIGHYCQQLGVGIDDLAETSGVSKQRLRSFSNHTLAELNSNELDSLFDVLGSLANAERRDMDEGRKPDRSYEDVINDVIFSTGGETK
jgi:hypothetical protein